ncbi:MAGUK p55 subfamily member 7 isoform X2 [Aplysia californica]|uniref:MAGUK p55 subfamily member 7 isoform X2 n=1 Tax=Aplysia californica TaxID=6500 RepID=A0ABM0ZY15_APLCA|nr:MAGUK p55 subfamily member 7 isoform X2 [Aplysia californica]
MPVNLPLYPHVKIDTDAQKLLVALPTLESRLPNKEPEIHYLRRFLRNRNLHLVLRIYRQFKAQAGSRKPAADFAVSQAADVYCEIRYRIEDAEVRELLGLLSKPHVQALLFCHDKVACEDYEPRFDPVPPGTGEDGTIVKIVRLIKNNEPLGATIYLNEHTGCVEIARVLHGGAAHRSGLLAAGDEVHEINGESVKGLEPDRIVEMLSEVSGSVTLKLVPCMKTNVGRKTKLKMRCLFTFDPDTDEHIPCREAGLAFKMGDILEIVSDEDPTWWQAQRFPSSETAPGPGAVMSPAGLVPSRHYQESVEVMRRVKLREAKHPPRSISPCRYSPKIPRQKRLRKTMYHIVQSGVFSEYDTDEIPTYEEVELYRPIHPLKIFRPIIFIGPPGVGRNELKRRLKASNPQHFEEVVPYTSREKRPHEEDGKEYNFLSREEMESQIISQKFVEYGEYKNNLYGTSLDSIKSVIQRGKVCLLAPHTQALKFIRTPELRPYIIFIKSPSLDRMKVTRTERRARSTSGDATPPLSVSEGRQMSFERRDSNLQAEEMRDIVEMSSKMEDRYRHLFDSVIINDDLETAATELLGLAARLEREPQWVPVGWAYS